MGEGTMRVLPAMAASIIFAMFSTAAIADDKSDCLNDKDRELQIKACSTIIQRDAKDAMAHYKRGVAYQFTGDFDRAIADYNKAIELRPRSARAYESRGSAYASKGVYTNAVADVTKASELAARKKAPPGPKIAKAAPPPHTKKAAKPAVAIKKSVENEASDTWPTWAPFGAGKL
jgi:tetratricopeptide (TPR) repeat protein